MFFAHLFRDYEKAAEFLQEGRQLNSDSKTLYIYITHKPPDYNHKVLPLFMRKYTNLNRNWNHSPSNSTEAY